MIQLKVGTDTAETMSVTSRGRQPHSLSETQSVTKPDRPLPYTQDPAIGSYSEPDVSNLQPYKLFLRSVDQNCVRVSRHPHDLYISPARFTPFIRSYNIG